MSRKTTSLKMSNIQPYRKDEKSNAIVFSSRKEFNEIILRWIPQIRARRMLNASLGGNRTAIRMRYNLMEAIIKLNQPIWMFSANNEKTINVNVVRLALRAGYSPDSVEKLEIIIEDIIEEFKESLLEKDEQKEQEGEFTI